MFYMLLVQMKGEAAPAILTLDGEFCMFDEPRAREVAAEILDGEGALGDLFEAYQPWPGAEYVKLVRCEEVEPAIRKIRVSGRKSAV